MVSIISESSITSLARRSTCGGGLMLARSYDLPFHVGALVIILTVSTLACAFPLVAVKFPALCIPANFLFVVRHFGTGVLIATAFVHLLPTAFISLTDPCLPALWNDRYPAMAGAIALAAVFLITVIEMVFSHGRSVCSLSPAFDPHVALEHGPEKDISTDCDQIVNPARRVNSTGQQLQRLTDANAAIDRTEMVPYKTLRKDMFAETVDEFTEQDSVHGGKSKQKNAVLQCLLLELSILFHSVFIGMALSVEVDDAFIVLLIAIAFHQTFEGLALGSRISSLSWSDRSVKPWLMALAYGCTTPIGQAIGLATHSLYDPDSETGLLVVGIMNAISSGLLIYTALVDLLAEDFLSDQSWQVLRGKRRCMACFLVFLGAFGMSLVGAWA
ncbi:Zinc/iron permease [Lipomyces chichibuensis]|uniref:Zinc/iron permease n=1 Tax=Lipomyces chichibuensis TaxID=1546026 RepID=UPI0033434EF1